MEEHDLNSLGKELEASDKQEQGLRQSMMSRRWFVRALAGVAAATMFGSSQTSEAADCNGQANTCDTNTCGPANTCEPNTCQTSNTCNPANECTTANRCDAANTCTTTNNSVCATGNVCQTNTCNADNTCNYNTCYTNTCATDTCAGVNTCKTNDSCTSDDQCTWPFDKCTGTNTDCGYFDV